MFLSLEQRKKKLSFLWFVVFFFVGVVCINVLDRLQYLVALEGRMLKGVDGYTFEG
jgi:hypothetical protein